MYEVRQLLIVTDPHSPFYLAGGFVVSDDPVRQMVKVDFPGEREPIEMMYAAFLRRGQ